MKKLIYLIFLSVAVTACNRPAADSRKATAHELTFDSIVYKEKITLENRLETTADATIPIAKGDSAIAKKINDKVFTIVRSIVGQENDDSSSYDELFKQFIGNYQAFVARNTDYRIGWEADIRGTVEYQSPSIVDIRLVSYTMTGGNHGNPFTTSLMFDPRNGKYLEISDIIKDKDAVTKLAESKFREKYNIPTGKSLNASGYMLDDDKFILPANIFITHEGLNLFYNVYEIAPYAEGTRELLLPYSEIKEYVNADYLPY